MTGFLLPGVLGLWLAVCVWVADRMGALLTDTTVRSELKVVVFLALLPLPLLDELIAKPQFDELCRTAAGVSHHAAPTDGRRVRQADLPPETVPGIAIPVQSRRWLFVDAHNGAPVLTVRRLQARGGKLARIVRRDRDAPITFDGRCGPSDLQAVLRQAGLVLVDGAAASRSSSNSAAQPHEQRG